MRWYNRCEESVAAEIYDISAEGVFVVSAHPLPEAVDVGDVVWVVVPSAAGEEVLTGTVRWRGFHPTHNLPGVGVELDAQGYGQVRRMFPSVRP